MTVWVFTGDDEPVGLVLIAHRGPPTYVGQIWWRSAGPSRSARLPSALIRAIPQAGRTGQSLVLCYGPQGTDIALTVRARLTDRCFVAQNRMIPYIEVGGETLQLEEARRLIAATTSTADQLDRDGGTTAVMFDDSGGALFGGEPLTPTEWRELADQLAAALLEAESAGSLRAQGEL